MLAASSDALNAEVAELLVHMCTAVPAYLEHPQDRTVGGVLTSLLAHPSWPQPADASWAVEVEALLASPVVDIEEVDGEERSVRALPADVSLELPDDVDMEVLDGLLQDLAGQTTEFSRSVQTLASGGAADDMEVAQRIAHTVKSVANTVGVAGLANLTHHLEEILLALGEHGAVPGPGLSEVLVRAADCLESMGKALLGQGTPPMDALEILQSILDWANAIDKQGVAAVADDAMPATPGGETDTDMEAVPSSTAPVTATAMVRVPAQLVDDLLRLLGETIILSERIQERLDVTANETQSLRMNIENHLGALRDMLSDQGLLNRESQ
jgi:chemosensory pili system protein ChpA (sensor histidine kinase/response regulator)